MCQDCGLEIDPKLIPRIAFGFAGGIGNTGSVCGAVAGGVMALSLGLDRGESMDVLRTVGEFRRRFEAQMKSISCRDLTGADLTTPRGIEQYMSSDAPTTVCPSAVQTAYEIAVDLLSEHRATRHQTGPSKSS